MKNNQTNTPRNKFETNDLVVAPVLVFISWYLLSYFWLYPQIYTIRTDSFLVLIIVAVVSRLATAIWTIILANKFQLRQNFWAVLALIIGPAQLIFINFSIWSKQSELAKKDTK